jgi:hypothetical protein
MILDAYYRLIKKTDILLTLMTDNITRQLLQQMHEIVQNGGGIFDSNIQRVQAPVPAQQRTSIPQRRIIPECPGLNRVDSRLYRWTVPHGASATDETYCERCTTKLGITGNVHQSADSNCNCDSYLRKNKADNGIINISFWEPDLYKFYDTEAVEGALIPTFFVKIPSGHKFCILLQSQNKQSQTFRYDIEHTSAGKDKPSLIRTESGPFVHDSTFVNDEQDKKYTWSYIDSQNPGWKLLEDHDCIKPGDSMTINIHIYNIKKHDFMLDSGRDLGRYTLTTSKTIRPKHNKHLEKEQNYFDHRPSLCLPSRDFERFTKNPMQMRFIFITDPNIPDRSDKLLNTAVSDAIKNTTSRVKQAVSNLARLNRSHQAHVTLLEHQTTDAQQKLDEERKLLERLHKFAEHKPELVPPNATDSDSDSDSDSD